MKKSVAAVSQFEALGIKESDYTDAMRLAVKQKWSSLPVDEKVGVLRARLAAVKPATVPAPTGLGPEFDTPEKAAKEVARLKRNAAVNAWRERNQIQAALDARDLKFAALRSKRGSKVDPAPAEAALAASA